MATTDKKNKGELLEELVNLINERDYLEFKIPSLIKEIKSLGISEKEVEEAGLVYEFKYGI